MNGRRLPWRIAAFVAVTLILTSCANGGRSGMDIQKSKQDGAPHRPFRGAGRAKRRFDPEKRISIGRRMAALTPCTTHS
jgi:hypothetical protein